MFNITLLLVQELEVHIIVLFCSNAQASSNNNYNNNNNTKKLSLTSPLHVSPDISKENIHNFDFMEKAITTETPIHKI